MKRGALLAVAMVGVVTGVAAAAIRASASVPATERRLSADAAAAPSVAIDLAMGNVRVTGSADDAIHAELRIGGGTDWVSSIALRTERRGDTVHVIVDEPRRFRLAGRLDVDLRVSVPHATAVTAASHMGNVTVRDVSSADARSGMGNVTIAGVTAATRAASNMGNVDVSIPDGWHPSDCSVETNMGNVVLDVPKGLRASYDLHTGLGKQRLRAATVVDGPPVRVRSGMGDVAIRER